MATLEAKDLLKAEALAEAMEEYKMSERTAYEKYKKVERPAREEYEKTKRVAKNAYFERLNEIEAME